jgi:hypothetical protein
VDRQEYSYFYDLANEPPYEDCAGEDMQTHGTILVLVKETTTPSGNLIVSGKVDYFTDDPVYLQGLTSGETWTLTRGHNPFGEVIKENGFYLLHFQWREWYSRDADGQKLQVDVRGNVKVDPDGNVKIERESIRCL